MSSEVAKKLEQQNSEIPSPGTLDFYNFTSAELSAYLEQKLSLEPYRAQQLFQWVYGKRVADPQLMSDIKRQGREVLAGTFSFPAAAIRERKISIDGTRKYLFGVDSGDLVESVMIKQPKRMTLCVSSQVGCALGCHFCQTGTMGLKRNLSASEIVRQILGVIDDAKNFGDMFTNIVFMGMGEPLHNFDNVVTALRILMDGAGLNFSGRKITISSAGLVPAIAKFGKVLPEVCLAISLNATTDEVRSQVMPINKRYPLETLLKTLREYSVPKRRRITIEYVLLRGINDTDADLARLPRLLRGIPLKLNLIPYNMNTSLGFFAPDKTLAHRWQKELNRHGLLTTIRWSKGADINAACGQLVTESKRASKNQLRMAL